MTKSKWIRLIEVTVAALFGLACAYYRTQLAATGQPLMYGGIGYSLGLLPLPIALAVVCFFLCALLLYPRQRLKGAEPGVPSKVINNLAGLGMLLAAWLTYSENTPDPGLIIYVQVIFLALCGVTLLLRTIQGENSAAAGMFSLFPLYYLCLLLLLFYRVNAKNPVALSFGFEVLAIVAVMLAVYAVSSRYFGPPRPRQQIFFCLLGVFFAVFELACTLIYPDLVLTVPGMYPSMLATLAAMGLYAAAGIFLPPRPKEVEVAEEEEPLLPEDILERLDLEPGDTLFLDVDVDVVTGSDALPDSEPAGPAHSDEDLAMTRYPKRGKYFEGRPQGEDPEDTEAAQDLFDSDELEELFPTPDEAPDAEPNENPEAEVSEEAPRQDAPKVKRRKKNRRRK